VARETVAPVFDAKVKLLPELSPFRFQSRRPDIVPKNERLLANGATPPQRLC
jgi:hypothetical protein